MVRLSDWEEEKAVLTDWVEEGEARTVVVDCDWEDETGRMSEEAVLEAEN